MHKKIYSNPDIYTIYIPLPDNPLKNLNCYVIKTKEKNLIIDTGFNSPVCYESLTTGLNEIGVDLKCTEMFLTHMHSDHTGLVSKIMNDDSVIYMSAEDYEYVKLMLQNYWVKSDESYIKEGFTTEELKLLRESNPAKLYNPDRLFNITEIEDNSKIYIGEYEFTCISTPGHTPGHMCLYFEKEKLLFSGDHILFDISPNISRWPFVDNSLRDYLHSLEKIKQFKVGTTFPAHRNNDADIYDRINQLLTHHDARLDEVMNIVKLNQGLNAYDIASKMKWSLKNRTWEDAPVEQKWFAVGEVLAHLDYLEIENKVEKIFSDGVYCYYIKL